MESEVYSEDFESFAAETEENKSGFKITLSFFRIIICSLILGAFALTKHFNYDNYKMIGHFYCEYFKSETIYVSEIRERIIGKTNIIHDFIREKISNL